MPVGQASAPDFKQRVRTKWLRMVRLWEREGTWAVVRGAGIKALRLLRRVQSRGKGRRAGPLPPKMGGTPADAYQLWTAAHEPDAQELARQRDTAEEFAYRPLISLITPVYNPPPAALQAALESVLAQTYDHWDLCLVDGGSGNAEIRAVLDEFAARDPRLRVTTLESNLGISGNSNQALALAQGEFVALFDHDDTLAPSLLYEVVARLNAMPQADILYCDEDHLTADGARRELPMLKPGWWSPELLLSTNYLLHSVIRRALVEEVGGFDSAYDGAQDWDLLLRCSERTHHIYHVPKILYHWRRVPGSATRQPEVAERQRRCVEAHLQRLGFPDPQARFSPEGFLRVTWPTREPKVSIIIPTKDKVNYLRRCLDSLLRLTTYPNYEVIVMDTGSKQRETQQYYDSLAQESRVRIERDTAPFNYSRINNEGVKHATGDVLLFLNNDVEILDPDWLEELVRWAERPEIGAVGAKLLYRDGSIQHAGVVLGMQGFASHIFWDVPEHYCGLFGCTDWYRDYMAVTGACMMMRREIFESVGGFDESYVLTFSDVEICLRIVAQGRRIVYTPFARLFHYEGRSRADHIPKNDLEVGYRHLRSYVIAGDPYFNPNLSDFSRRPVIDLETETRLHYLERMMRFYGVLDASDTGESEET